MHPLSQRRTRRCSVALDARRTLVDGKPLIDFSRNDYLGLSHDPQMTSLWGTFNGHPTGSGGSALICGYHPAHAELEKNLADFLGYPRVLLVNNGYLANQLVLSTLVSRHHTVLLDRLAHASLIEGTRLSGAKLKRFKHGCLEDLEKKLASSTQPCWVVTDGVFSMEGDLAPLPAMSALCKAYGATLMVDDAHGIGVMGKDGRGTVSHFHLGVQDVPVLVGTFGKAFGAYGAFVAGTDEMTEKLISQGRAYIYTTSLPDHMVRIAIKALSIIKNSGERREHLKDLIERTQKIEVSEGFWRRSQTPIQSWVLGADTQVQQWHNYLKAEGFWVPVIRPPTVPKGSSCLRFSLSAAHKRADIVRLQTTIARLEVMNYV